MSKILNSLAEHSFLSKLRPTASRTERLERLERLPQLVIDSLGRLQHAEKFRPTTNQSKASDSYAAQHSSSSSPYISTAPPSSYLDRCISEMEVLKSLMMKMKEISDGITESSSASMAIDSPSTASFTSSATSLMHSMTLEEKETIEKKFISFILSVLENDSILDILNHYRSYNTLLLMIYDLFLPVQNSTPAAGQPKLSTVALTKPNIWDILKTKDVCLQLMKLLMVFNSGLSVLELASARKEFRSPARIATRSSSKVEIDKRRKLISETMFDVECLSQLIITTIQTFPETIQNESQNLIDSNEPSSSIPTITYISSPKSSSSSIINSSISSNIKSSTSIICSTLSNDYYVSIMKPLQFGICSLEKDHLFAFKPYNPSCNHTGDHQFLKRIANEMSILSTSLPLHKNGSIFVRFDEDRMDLLTAIIVGSSGTPFEGGCFIFDLQLPGDYPAIPPNIKCRTVAQSGQTFFHHTHADGSLCLSLVGTHSGGLHSENWQQNGSTILQLLVSIQSFIMENPSYYRVDYYSAISSLSQKYAIRHYLTYEPATELDSIIRTHFSLIKPSNIVEFQNNPNLDWMTHKISS